MSDPTSASPSATPQLAPDPAAGRLALNEDWAATGVPAPTRDAVRRSIADQLLGALDELVARHRALALHDEHIELHAELIAAEVAHQLAMARSRLHSHPAIRSPRVGARAAR
jgi:hypothetical protein